MGAEEDEPDEVECDGIEAVVVAELKDEYDEAGRSAYNTSWLLDVGSETAAADIVDDEGSVASEVSRALSGSLLLGGGSMAFSAPKTYLFWHQFSEPFPKHRSNRAEYARKVVSSLVSLF